MSRTLSNYSSHGHSGRSRHKVDTALHAIYVNLTKLRKIWARIAADTSWSQWHSRLSAPASCGFEGRPRRRLEVGDRLSPPALVGHLSSGFTSAHRQVNDQLPSVIPLVRGEVPQNLAARAGFQAKGFPPLLGARNQVLQGCLIE